MIFGDNKIQVVNYSVEFDDTPTEEFKDVNGNTFVPSPERLLGHELAHAYINIFGGTYHDAVRFENIIARELDPNAPIRAISDHGTSKPLGLK